MSIQSFVITCYKMDSNEIKWIQMVSNEIKIDSNGFKLILMDSNKIEHFIKYFISTLNIIRIAKTC